jgi:preprotein translocase subunit SecF
MKTILSLALAIGVLNVALFAFMKLFNWVEPFFFKLFLKRELIEAIQKDPEFQERSKVRAKYTHWFWSVLLVFYYGLIPLSGLNFYLAFVGGLMLYFIGSTESAKLEKISSKHRIQEYVDAQQFTEKFFEELAKRIETMEVDKKDDERN